MDAIRAAIAARQRAADEARIAGNARVEPPRRYDHDGTPLDDAPPVGDRANDVVMRFRASMEIDYERWKEGIGYDLSLLAEATPDERRIIECVLVGRGVYDWRDVEALAACRSERADAVLRNTLLRGSAEHAVSVLRFAPQLASEAERTALLVRALADTAFFHGLSTTLHAVAQHHPQAVIDALLRGVLTRDDGAQVHFVAMLMFLHGRAPCSFDWEQRPYFLRFNTQDHDERRALFRELCGRLCIDAAPYLEH